MVDHRGVIGEAAVVVEAALTVYLPSGEKMVMPGPLASLIRVFSALLVPSSTATQTSLPLGLKNASCGERARELTCLTAFVAVSMRVTQLGQIETTARIRSWARGCEVNEHRSTPGASPRFLLLRDDDLLGQPFQPLVLAEAKFDRRHVDRP
jgi:hypothetical protein